MNKLCLTVLAFLIAYSSAPTSQAQDPQTSPNRGFGKVAPGFQSFFHVQREHPFFLVDNQGRNAAEIQVYVKYPPGQSPKVQVLGNEQSELNVPLRVVVTNLTTECSVSVEWLAFDFREDGQASSRGLGTPPGANPNTDVPAGGSYIHTFHFTAVTTFKNGKAVLNEVLPALALQCPLAAGDQINSSSKSLPASAKSAPTVKAAGRNVRQRQAMAMAELVRDFPLDKGTSSYVMENTSGCSISVRATDAGYTEVWTLPLGELVDIKLISCENGHGGWLDLRAIHWDHDEQIQFGDFSVGDKLSVDLEVAAKSCGIAYKSSVRKTSTPGCQ